MTVLMAAWPPAAEGPSISLHSPQDDRLCSGICFAWTLQGACPRVAGHGNHSRSPPGPPRPPFPPSILPHPPSPGDIYRERIARFARDAARLTARFDRLANLRLLAALGAVGGALAGAYWTHGPLAALLWLTAALASAGTFVALLAVHARVHEERERAQGLGRINTQSLARLERAWPKLPLPPVPPSVRANVLAGDLDLFGHGSLFHLLGTAGTPQGRHTLAAWFTSPPEVAGTIPARQAAVAELAPALDLRQELELAAAELAGAAPAGDDPFVSWVSAEPWLLPRPALVWATRLVPVLLLGSAGLFFAGRLGFTIPGLLLVASWGVTRHYGREVRRRLDVVSARQRPLRSYGALFGRLARWQPAAPRLAELHRRLQGADAAMGSLETLAGLAAMRTTLANPLAQYLFLWDFHTLFLMERWQQRHGAQVRGWFEALGEVEALAALSVLAFEEPAWPFPLFTDEPRIAARALGHPLLPAASRVANDVTVGPPGTFLLVTGSNMSGKSTLLRTLGINAVLAQAGAPVCAQELRLPPSLVLATSLRVQDSLQEGVSFFMAELRRLASVVEQADRADARPGGPVVLYLLDEILRGTNTQERQTIVGRVIAHLLRCRAIGAVTTHDLSLAEAEGLAAACQAVHFTEDFEEGPGGATMRFDYRMRPGLATTTNALKLLQVIGLKL